MDHEIVTARARRLYTDAQRAHYRAAFDAAIAAVDTAIATSGHFSDETAEASRAYRIAYRNLGIVEGWHA